MWGILKKFAFTAIFAIMLLWLPRVAIAQEPYVIDSFDSEITINKDASITVHETIEVSFMENRHGIYRYIPVVYRANGGVVNSKLQVLSVNHSYETSRDGDYLQIKIGDPDKYVLGQETYEIVYRVRNVVRQYDDHDELYWNVAGDGWDTAISATEASVKSPFANINKIQCFEGFVGVDTKCESLSHDSDGANFIAGGPIGNGREMTIVVAVNKNQLNYTVGIVDRLRDSWAYPVAIAPFVLLLIAWYKRGRDSKYAGDNIYYEPKNKETQRVSVFNKREFIPTVYGPIAGLTPAEIGTLVDERVDIHDVVAEIVELGRLSYLRIEKIDKKLAKDDYLIKKLKEPDSKLRDYQKYLHESIFSFGDEKGVLLSELKQKFYVKLEKFRDKLYEHLDEKKYFYARPDKTRLKWLFVAIVLVSAAFFLTFAFYGSVYDFWPVVLSGIFAAPAFVFAYQMPRKTPAGYSLFRQTKGLAFYLEKGKWREEIKEKQLFLDEILPLAISLGVVKKLARDMQEIGVQEPSYFTGSGVAWASSLNSFSTSASANLAMGKSSSGGWSGGSGFSGGSGGGFGGGGGGSW